MYYYLKEQKGFDIRIIGLDLKKEVIEFCNELSEKFGFEKLKFLCGDIAEYEGVDQVDMVVTLHACDTATDYALAKAVKWGARVILSVPCCQHEINRQIQNEELEPILGYGLLKERISALITTDGIRAQVLEHYGYRTQILEFIDMEHTPKNLLIRAVRQGNQKKQSKTDTADFEFFCPETYDMSSSSVRRTAGDKNKRNIRRNDMKIRRATMEEIDDIMNMYETGRQFMREHGNQMQWIGEYHRENWWKIIAEMVAFISVKRIKSQQLFLCIWREKILIMRKL